MGKNIFSFTVVFTLPGKAKWAYPVRAASETEAVNLAKYKAGREKVPVFDCKIEVNR
jgi:hypothetical protein